MLIDTSDNDSYNQVHWLIGMPHLSTKTSNDSDFGESFIFRESFRFREIVRFRELFYGQLVFNRGVIFHGLVDFT